ncbi:cysteine-rich receptor-like protein kinase 6 isoform X2 [Lolium perenne]|uniref:cysteine-rich receptor-like protein kinase 6 isoform X2 n=1 Tax=Lolium perenne TaxID=4522 RepID=UPI003A99068A
MDRGYPWSHALLLLALLPLAAAQPWSVCNSSSGSYSSGSTYGANLVSLVGTLRQKSASSMSLFASGVLGAAPDTVYGLILCRGDVSFSDCFDCGSRARDDAATACTGRSRDVALCYNQCYVRLADTDFLASTDNSGEVPLISGTNISSSDVAGYNQALTGLLDATAQYAVDNTTTLFATGQWEGPDPGFSRIYSVAQCAADISPALCRSCLQDLWARWFTWFHMPPKGDGARVAGSRCSLRYQIGQDPFYTGAAMLQLPAKTPAPGPGPAATAATPDNKKSNSKRVVLIAVIVSVVLIFLLVGMCMLWKIYWKELKLITKNFESTIGKGGFGIVYHGILENGDEVAVKVLMETSIAESTDFLPEVQTLSKVHHKNLVTLQGYCQNKKCLALVYDFMPRGNLQQLLRGAEDYTLNWEQRLHIAFDSAQGLEYLHELCTPSIVHRDVKTANILLDKNLVGIISDFGLSRAFNDAHTHISTVAAGTLGYLDPEYHATFQLTVKTDVYSFGIVLLEIITGQPPVIMDPQPVHLPNWVRKKITKGSINDVVDKRLLDVYNASSLQSVIDLAMDCVENAAIDRPAMTEVVARLKVWLPVVSSEKRSVNGPTQYKYSMDSEIRKQYQLSISGASTEGSSFQSGSTGRMSEISMSSGR